MVQEVSATVPRQQFVINTYPYTRLPAELCLSQLADQGYRAFELMCVPGHFWPSIDGAAGRIAITALLARRNLRVLTINQPSLDINLSSSIPEMRQHSCSLVIGALRLAAEWGAIGAVINPGRANPVFAPPVENVLDWYRHSLDVLVPEAQSLGVRLIVKNHPLSYLHTAFDLGAFFDEYGWDHVGIGYDFANGCFARENPGTALLRLKGHLDLVYAADTSLQRFDHAVVGTGAVHFQQIAGVLQSIGYSGSTVLEIISEDPSSAIELCIARLESHAWPLPGTVEQSVKR